MRLDVERFKNWLINRGAEILPTTNQWEAIRFKGKEIGVLYTSGKVSNHYTTKAVEAYKENKRWDGKPQKIARKSSYKKHKISLLKRDGENCFLCGKPLCEDITLEHLISLSAGGKNTLGNMVLMHDKCNQKVGNLTVAEKVNIAIKNRLKE